jgi:hypothetical protein
VIARWAAAVAAVLLGVVVAFQVALILGAPWGRFTQGGTQEGSLPASGRAVAAVSVVILVSFALALLGRVGWGPLAQRRRLASVWSWVAIAYAVVAVPLNAATPSAVERAVWLPFSVLLLAAELVTVLRSRRNLTRVGLRP